MRCPFCGHENIAGTDLCESCGSDRAGLDLHASTSGFKGQLLTDKLGNLALGPAVCLAGDANVKAAVEAMRESHHGCVLIQEGERLAGIFTERDLLTRVLRKGLDPAETVLADVMTPRPFALSSDDPPAFAIHRMDSGGLRHLPILDDGVLKGFISVRNVLRYIHEDVLSG
jgi:CBS domain-containing protein